MECENCGLDNPVEARFCANCGAALIYTGKQPLPAEPTAYAEPVAVLEYIGFWTRLVAAIVDGVVVWLLSYTLSFLIRILPSEFSFLYLYLNSFIILLLYYWLFTGLKGQTPGKMLFGIKVVDARGNKPGLVIAAMREIPGKIISTVVFFIGFLWIAVDTQKQGLHDKLATTYVIKVQTEK
ncbi:RDD family protein [Chloroflexota bacterium]